MSDSLNGKSHGKEASNNGHFFFKKSEEVAPKDTSECISVAAILAWLPPLLPVSNRKERRAGMPQILSLVPCLYTDGWIDRPTPNGTFHFAETH